MGVTAVMAASTMTACGSSQDDEPAYAGVCADEQTGVRLDDEQCRCVDAESNQWRDDDDCRQHRTRSHASWYFIPYGLLAAGIGQRVVGGSFGRPPQDRSYRAGGVAVGGGRVSSSTVKGGTTISRGGFGARGGGSGG